MTGPFPTLHSLILLSPVDSLLRTLRVEEYGLSEESEGRGTQPTWVPGLDSRYDQVEQVNSLSMLLFLHLEGGEDSTSLEGLLKDRTINGKYQAHCTSLSKVILLLFCSAQLPNFPERGVLSQNATI